MSGNRTPKEKITELRRQLEEVSRDYDKALEENDSLGKELESIRTTLSGTKDSLRRVEKELTETKSENSRRLNRLADSLRQTQNELERKVAENEMLKTNLEQTIAEAKHVIGELQAKIEELTAPPHRYCAFLRTNDDKTVDVSVNGERMAVPYDPSLDVSKFEIGQILRLGPTMAVLKPAEPFDFDGEAATVRELLDDARVIVSHRFEEEKIIRIVESLIGKVKIGDRLLLDTRGQMGLEKLPKLEVKEFEIEEVPNVTFDDIGGLDAQIELIKESIVWPFLHRELFDQHQLTPIKGALFFGPPGNGKTMLGKALANYIAHEVQRLRGWDKPKSYFMYIPGPAFLRGIVGQTEALMRDIFATARAKGREGGIPVIIFIDEMEAIVPVRGSGISTDIDKTNVPQLCSLIDGLEELRNVIIIGASNRQDLIDSAILREGRLDKKIRIDRPNEIGTRQILSKHLKVGIPIHPKYDVEIYVPTDSKGNPRADENGKVKEYHFGKDPQKVIDYFITLAVNRIFNEKLSVEYRNKAREEIHLKEYLSGAMLKNIVDRAKMMSIKAHLKGEPIGIQTSYIMKAIVDAAKENEELVRHGAEITDIRTSVPAGGKREIKDIENDDSML